jgi:hypothetical protein
MIALWMNFYSKAKDIGKTKMTFRRIEDMDPNYRDRFAGRDIKGMSVVSDLTAGMLTDDTNERIGTVYELLVDQQGGIQYVVIDLGAAMTGRRVLLPADKVRIDDRTDRVYAAGLTKEQAEMLPVFNEQAAL